MKTVGSYEMKTHIARILKEVAAGESMIVTLHGTPVAKISPVAGPDRERRLEALNELKRLRSEKRLNPGGIREWIDEGRR